MLVYFCTVVLIATLLVSVTHFSLLCLNGACEDFHVKRWIFSIFMSLTVAAWGLKRKSLDWTGAVSGVVVGIVLTFSSYCFLACLLTFFYTCSKATHYCSEKKKKLEVDFKEGGQRNWIQVVCNGGAAVEVSLLYLMHGGVGECLLDFEAHYARSWLAASVLSALAGATGDTWASEIGTVVAGSEPLLITSFQKVPVGTNGGFTVAGLLYSALGGGVIGASYLAALLASHDAASVVRQAGCVLFAGTFAGLFGSVLDSVIGATLQYSGVDVRSGKIVECPGAGVKRISGRPLLTNHSVNLVMSVVNSILVPTLTASLCLSLG
ncbi:transmembrane protein 19-like [Uloborus diversus]|uniref:transmembrane protein 19-like n=1 Tax=Uloborus diversus TaxID=327109 RepID=UPI0024098400|nr:transmembrane protein 19-like [Uloborus diversus]